MQPTANKVTRNGTLIILEDSNAKFGDDSGGLGNAMCTQGTAVLNQNGERLLGFCMAEGLVLGGKTFPHKKGTNSSTWTAQERKQHAVARGNLGDKRA